MKWRRIVVGIAASCALDARATPVDPTSNQWRLESKEEPSSAKLTLTLPAQQKVKGWLTTGRPILTIQCRGGSLAVYVETGVALEVTQVDQQIVRVRFDDSEFRSERWREVGNWTVSSRHPDRLLGQLLQARRFVLEFAPFSSEPVQADFAVQGLTEYAGLLARSCGGELPEKKGPEQANH